MKVWSYFDFDFGYNLIRLLLLCQNVTVSSVFLFILILFEVAYFEIPNLVKFWNNCWISFCLVLILFIRLVIVKYYCDLTWSSSPNSFVCFFSSTGCKDGCYPSYLCSLSTTAICSLGRPPPARERAELP